MACEFDLGHGFTINLNMNFKLSRLNSALVAALILHKTICEFVHAVVKKFALSGLSVS